MWLPYCHKEGRIIAEQQQCFSYCANGEDVGGIEMARFIDDLAGAIYDFCKFILTSICYLVAGMLIVGVPLYLIAFVFSMFH